MNVTDSFCTGGNTIVMVMMNTGTKPIRLTELIIMDDEGNVIRGGKWYNVKGSEALPDDAEIKPGKR